MTVPSTARAFLRGQLAYFAQHGWEVHVICGEPGLEDFVESEGVSQLHVVRAKREPSLLDPATLMRLWWVLLKTRPDAVVMGTPKIGVLGTLAARLVGVPVRIYLIHGYRAEGLSGLQRQVVRALDRLACRASTQVIAVSHSLERKLVGDGVTPASRVKVLGAGSANGLDLERFQAPSPEKRKRLRDQCGLPTQARVIACVGRLTRDKGLGELSGIWQMLVERHPEAWLIIAGTPEPHGNADVQSLNELSQLPRVRMLGQVEAIEESYQVADVLLLLSKREGLVTVAIEAAACGVPTVGYSATGVTDAVVDGVTGILVEQGDMMAVSNAATSLLNDEPLRLRFGEAARLRVTELFRQEAVWEAWETLLRRECVESIGPR